MRQFIWLLVLSALFFLGTLLGLKLSTYLRAAAFGYSNEEGEPEHYSWRLGTNESYRTVVEGAGDCSCP